ncbi:MAG: adenosine kinase [Spirochaetia bacterium]|jgi:sugar/nucleoside kinase (ribokinase family)|nr:adenosine kinase [Spirochaetia bacterium]
MKSQQAVVYGIGNTLVDIITRVAEEDLMTLGLSKGAMQLIDGSFREKLLRFIEGKPVTYSCGGSAANTLIALSQFNVCTILAGKVGRDTHGNLYHDRLGQFNIIDQLRDCNQSTGSSIILDTPDSERTMNTYLCANREFNETDVDFDSVRRADYFYFTGYMWDTDNQKKAIQKVLDYCKTEGTAIVFDVADPFAVQRYKEEFLYLIDHYCDVVFANRDESRILLGCDDVVGCCSRLGQLCPTAVVKNGVHGSVICDKGKIYQIPVAGSIHPVDTTGAGDMYAAGFLLGLCRNCTIEACGNIASLLAGQIISQTGAQFTEVNLEVAKEKLTELSLI